MPQASYRQRAGAARGRAGRRAPDAGWVVAAARGDVAVRRYSAGPANGRAQARTQMADWRAWPRAGARSTGHARGRAAETPAFAAAGNFKSLARSHAATRGGARARAGCGTVGAVSCTDARHCWLAGGGAMGETARRPRP